MIRHLKERQRDCVDLHEMLRTENHELINFAAGLRYSLEGLVSYVDELSADVLPSVKESARSSVDRLIGRIAARMVPDETSLRHLIMRYAEVGAVMDEYQRYAEALKVARINLKETAKDLVAVIELIERSEAAQ
jgi:hypothetical protein